MEHLRKPRNIVTIERKRNYLVSEPNHCTTKFLTENLLGTEKKKTYTYEQTCLFGTFNTRIK